MQIFESDKRLAGVPQDQLEREWLDWRCAETEDVANLFRTMCRTSPHITPESEESGPGFDQIMEKLAKDKRFVRLSHMPDEQVRIVRESIRAIRDLREDKRKEMGVEATTDYD